MKRDGSTWLTAGTLMICSLWLLAGCNKTGTVAQGSPSPSTNTSHGSIPAGTRIVVTLGSTISSEFAHVGDTWHGTVTRGVTTADGSSVPAGSRVDGEVTGVTAARRGARAMVQLDLTQVRIDGDALAVDASANPVIAGSTRKRNVGAIAGGALAGALIGRVVGDGRNATAGALVGGAAATGVVAESRGFQIVLARGTVMRFTVSQSVAMR